MPTDYYSPQAAREKIRADKSIKAAVSEGFANGPGGLLNDASTRVRLYKTVGEAQEKLRMRRAALLADGWKVTYGAVNRGILTFGKDGHDDLTVALDKRRG